MVYNWAYSVTGEPLTDEDRLERGIGNGPLHVDQTTFRSKANRQNDYLIDRAVQRTQSFTGIDGVNVQDRAIQETMGGIVDRCKEHLGPADKAIIQLRRLLRQAVKTAEGGRHPRRRAAELLPAARRRDGGAARRDWRGAVTEGLAQEEILQTV